tara:strand:+ start:1497 stop:2747 length:1251 start_codon:yes stop_codon:yes gene_type:complete
MSNLKKKVIHSFKWKKDDEYCASKIGVTQEEYRKVKKQILNDRKKERRLNKLTQTDASGIYDQKYNIEEGKATFTGVSQTEPKTPEEIIKLLNIDTTKWKLSQFWNKQMSDHWRISALVTKLKDQEENHLKELINNWKPKKYKIPKLKTPKGFSYEKETVCGIMSLQDIHFGKEGNETIDKDFEDSVLDLIKRGVAAHNIDTLYFIVGGDLINMDTFNGTTTSGTPLDNCTRATNAYIQAFDAMHWAINVLVNHCNKLVVVYIPGNHDRLSSYHLVHALSKSIDSEQIEWDAEYAERKVHVWGNNFNAFEHGDAVSKNTPIVYATEFALDWGRTKNRTLFTGHFHQNKKIEYITTSETTGFIHKTLPSLSKTDYYHYHNKYVGNRRSAKLELQTEHEGNICELTYTSVESEPFKLS